MGASRWACIAALSAIWLPGAQASAVSSVPSVAAWAAPLPAGRASVELTCAIRARDGGGAALAAFAVTDDRFGLTETSFYADISWNHVHAAPSIRTGGTGVDAPAVDVAVLDEEYRVRLSLTWGGSHRTWAATVRAACAASGAETSGTAVATGTTLPPAGAELLLARASDFAGLSASAGAGAGRGGSLNLDGGGALLGTFSAAAGDLTATDPSGFTTRSGPREPWIPISGSRAGPWSFDLAWAAWVDPGVLLRVVRFAG